MGWFSKRAPIEETPEEAAAPRVRTSDREVDVLVPAGNSARNYRHVLAAIGEQQLVPGDNTGRFDVALVRRGPGVIVVRARGYDLGVVPDARYPLVDKALASVPADIIRVRAKLWRKTKDGTYGVRLHLPWGLKAADGGADDRDG